MAYENFWRGGLERYGGDRWRSTSGDWRNAGRERSEGGYYGSRGWNPRGEFFTDRPSGYSGEGYLGERYRGSARGVDYERNWGNEGRNYYGDRDYYGDREHGGYGVYGSDIDYEADQSRAQDIGSGLGERGDYRGRGPRGYRPSDERIRENVCDALTDDAWIDASNLDVAVDDCEVTLSGTVDSREQKRRAENLAEHITGVIDVHNRLRISGESSRRSAKVSLPGL